jgi:hypothetical protein
MTVSLPRGKSTKTPVLPRVSFAQPLEIVKTQEDNNVEHAIRAFTPRQSSFFGRPQVSVENY